jgi:predicted dithiol-disulfide oxidoreductase (DUF899 family)
MLEKNSLFYMANLYPEIGRMYSFLDSGKIEASKNAQKRALDIIEQILSFKDVKPAGREEWNVVKNFTLDYENLDSYERKILERYAEPFSYKFMSQYALG